ncbi:MAG: ribose 5-phosphate isomerase A [Solirubrobacterales bacterium]
MADVEHEKQLAAEEAAELVEDGMRVGLGTGSTVAYLLPALAERRLDIRCVATSVHTEQAGNSLGLKVEPFDRLERLDIAIDGADQVAPDCWLIKGGGAALTREKVVAAAADRFVVIVSANKTVPALTVPVPLELLPFGLASTLARVAPTEVRDAPPSPDGGVIADYMGDLDDAAALAERLSVAGVVEHGLFPPELVAEVIVATGKEISRMAPGQPPR